MRTLSPAATPFSSFYVTLSYAISCRRHAAAVSPIRRHAAILAIISLMSARERVPMLPPAAYACRRY
jgi:hypothetical protein